MYTSEWAVPQGILVCDNHQVLTMFTRNAYNVNKKCNINKECSALYLRFANGMVLPHCVVEGHPNCSQ